jgi:hypothetical protein
LDKQILALHINIDKNYKKQLKEGSTKNYNKNLRVGTKNFNKNFRLGTKNYNKNLRVALKITIKTLG